MRMIFGLGLSILMVAAVAGCGDRAQSQTPAPGAAPAPPEVYYTLPETKEVTDFEDFTGHTEAVKMVQVRSRVSGYLVKVNFIDGAEVHQGQVLFEIDNRPYVAELENKEAVAEQTERHSERLKAEFERAQKAFPKGMTQEEYDQRRFDYVESLATLRAAKASAEIARQNVQFTKITADIAGKVSRRLVDPGNVVIADNTQLTTIVSEDPIYGNFDIDEHTLLKFRRLVEQGKLKKENDSPVSLALSDEQGFPHRGTINFVDNQLDPQTGTLRFRGTFANADRLLSPGLFIRVRLPIGPPHQALVIPEVALNTDQGRKFVWVVNKKNEATYAAVEVGPPFPGELRVIESGLNTGDRVIVSGLQRIARSGLVVNAKELKPATAPANSAAPPEKPRTPLPKPTEGK